MGLDTSHNCWHGSYSSFARFRNEVADHAKTHYGYVPNYDGHPERALYGWWDKDHPFSDILDVFFLHSDCEGWIFPKHAELLADRLDALVDYASDDGTQWCARARLRQFVDGLRRAADQWEVVAFR